MTSKAPTVVPTVSPSQMPTVFFNLVSNSKTQMPTNSTPTFEPNMYPSVSPTLVASMSAQPTILCPQRIFRQDSALSLTPSTLPTVHPQNETSDTIKKLPSLPSNSIVHLFVINSQNQILYILNCSVSSYWVRPFRLHTNCLHGSLFALYQHL